MGFRAVWPKYGFGLLACRNRGCCGIDVMSPDLRFPFQSSLACLTSPRFRFLRQIITRPSPLSLRSALPSYFLVLTAPPISIPDR